MLGTYVYIYIYTYIHTTYIQACIHTKVFYVGGFTYFALSHADCIHTYIHTYPHTYIRIHTPTYPHTYVGILAGGFTYITSVHTYTHTYIHTYIHTCIHTYIPRALQDSIPSI